ncbi:Cytochrome c-type biogenesis protein CcmH precursor [Pragia fontium]|nr:c-type cytochrome biogenesis protein CcmI [Pragia fontium]SUB81891.1 Cytochrome c-type biogenesis protein CcmH precursor [Pragia fontium]
MIAFWLTIIVLLVIGAALLIVPTMCKANPDTDTNRDAINKAYYQQRLTELTEDEAQGVIAERETMVAELQHNLLEDIPVDESVAKQTSFNRLLLLPGVLLMLVVSLGLYLHTGGLGQVMQWQQVMKEMPDLRHRADTGQLSTPEDIARFALGLRTDLLSEPANVRDWTMLGLAGLKLGNGEMALQAYEKAYQLAPNDAYIQIIYAKLLTRSNDPNDIQQASAILKDILKTNPNNVDALSALAMNAFGRGDFNQAIAAWEKVLTLLPADANGIDVIKSSLAYAKAQLTANGYRLSVKLSLAPEMAAQLPAEGSVLIAVTDGESPVPVAVKQLPLGQFPLELSLDDSNAMMPSRLLSSLKKVKIKATITSNDRADNRHITGESDIQPFSGKETVDVTIGHIKQ